MTETGCFLTPKALPVRLFVALIVAFMPNNFAVAFEGKDVGSHAVQKPSIVTDDNRATTEVKESFLQGAECIDVKVVGRFIQKEEVTTILEQLGQMNAVAFPT